MGGFTVRFKGNTYTAVPSNFSIEGVHHITLHAGHLVRTPSTEHGTNRIHYITGGIVGTICLVAIIVIAALVSITTPAGSSGADPSNWLGASKRCGGLKTQTFWRGQIEVWGSLEFLLGGFKQCDPPPHLPLHIYATVCASLILILQT